MKILHTASVYLTCLALLILMGLFFPGHSHAQQVLGNPTALQQSTTAESSRVLKSSGGYLYALGVTTSVAGWLMMENTVAAPSNGAVTPSLCYQIAANSTQYFLYPSPVPFTTGITATFSSTGCFTQTLANAFFMAQVR